MQRWCFFHFFFLQFLYTRVYRNIETSRPYHWSMPGIGAFLINFFFFSVLSYSTLLYTCNLFLLLSAEPCTRCSPFSCILMYPSFLSLMYFAFLFHAILLEWILLALYCKSVCGEICIVCTRWHEYVLCDSITTKASLYYFEGLSSVIDKRNVKARFSWQHID